MINHSRTLIIPTLSLLVLSFAGIVEARQISVPKPTPTPTPIASPNVVKPPAIPSPTITDLQTKIRARLSSPIVRRGQVGVKIVSLNTGKVVFEENGEKYFMPASNMKNFTVATALEKLTPDYRFVTSVFAASMPDANGTVKGDLRIYGRGDVSISTAFFGVPNDPETYFKGIDRLVEKITAAGVKRIEGSIVADDSYFKGYAIPETWEWDDLQSYFGAEVSALPLNDNAVDLSVTPGPIGYPCTVKLKPYNPVYRAKNLCITTAAGTPRTLKIVKVLGQNHLEITGMLPLGNAGFSNPVSVSRPAELFAALLKQRLELKGITVTGQYRTYTTVASVPPITTVEIAKMESPPLSLIAAKTMKPSQNMYTETLLWTLGEDARQRISTPTISPGTPQQDSSGIGIAEVKSFLTSIGVAPDGIIQYDGSGLSRHNLITPAAVVQLYVYMSRQSKYSQAWRDSLTIGGVDGTLANRFKGTLAAGNMRGKTGTIDQVSALSGYVTTSGGEQLVLSIVVNGVAVTKDRTSLIDDVVVELANYKGKID
jgi:D-alanyl-D-alanine carboxypeptidase/D-alanyl-D-alanine-endopeptidase (penicillin-binding protein 4)